MQGGCLRQAALLQMFLDMFPGCVQMLTRSPGGPAGPSPPELPWEGRERSRKAYYYFYYYYFS